ncbi:hypothetical protein [uncultured Algibacter sp.]|uniref:hypothetical protein n=1 Tax=uncultured Algibacter sp. TaxID=298659 RepID=UPI0026337486|nr:hypothetical protein [uncultured Algibacter sp.]
MDDFDFKRKRYVNETPVLFIIVCLCNYNFNSFRNFLIYIFYFLGFLDLRIKDSSQYSDEQLVKYLELIYKKKINKKDLYELTKCNKNTFNKRFKKYFELKGYVGKRKFTLFETYGILNEWQGDGNWGMMQAISKERLAKTINSGNYKNLANEFSMLIGEENYKSKDKFSPKEVKKLLDHIDLSESREAQKLLRYDEFQSISLWVFGLFIVQNALNNMHSIQQ